MKKIIILLATFFMAPLCATDNLLESNNASNTNEIDQAGIMSGGCVVDPENVIIIRKRCEQLLKVIAHMAPDNEHLVKTCQVACCVIQKAAETDMALAEQLYWSRRFINCINAKIKTMSPDVLLCIKATQKALIDHAYAILKQLKDEDEADLLLTNG